MGVPVGWYRESLPAKEVVMARFDLKDFEWDLIRPLLPNKPRAVVRVDDRRVLNGILCVLRPGSPWRGLPERDGPRPPSTIGSTDGPRRGLGAFARGAGKEVASGLRFSVLIAASSGVC